MFSLPALDFNPVYRRNYYHVIGKARDITV